MSRISRLYSLGIMLLVLMAAAILRLPNLSEVPPGLHYDEAANGVLAADIGLRGDRPVFIPSFTGKEVFFFYLAGGLMRFVGDSVFTLRLTTAFVGLLTVAASYWLGWELLRDRRIALLAATLLAVSFWHLLFSRLGFRAITQPLLQALTVASLLRGIRRKEGRWLLAAGVFLGLTAYTYLAARIFPVLLLLAMLPWFFNRQDFRQRWPQFLWVVFTALLVLLPLLGYFIIHPETFWVRIDQVAPGGANQPGLSAGFLKSLGMFFLEGDPYWRFNLPLRPLFNWFWGGLLIVGWIGLLLRWPHLPNNERRSTSLLLLLAPVVMILPTALATGEILPSNLRAIGLIPFIFYLPAAGLLFLLEDVEKWTGHVLATKAMLAIAVLSLVVGGMQSGEVYFRTWALRPEVYYETDGDLTAVAQFLDQIETENKTIYVAALHYQHPTLAFLSQQYGQIKWLPQSQALVFPSAGTAIYVYPHNSPAPDWAEPFLATAVPLTTLPAPTGEPAFAAYEMAALPPLAIPHPINANFGDVITLLGYEMDQAAVNAMLPLTLYWRVENRPSAEYVPFVHLEDAWHYRWGQKEIFAYPSVQWQPGELIIQHVDVPVTPGAPPGTYRLRVGLFAPSTGERLPRLDDDGRYAGDSFVIENAKINPAPPPDRLPQPPVVIGAQVREGLRFLGYTGERPTAVTGETVTAELWWLAGQAQPALTTRLELHPAAGAGRILANTQPVHNTFPFDDWPAPIFLIDHVDGRIPDDLPSGDYRLRLRILDGNDETLYETDLGPLTVEVSQRLFQLPRMTHPLEATFGDEIALSGYDLEPVGEGQFTLTLAWQAVAPPADDYTVFVHLLDSDGVCCLWQADMMPRQNQYPTSHWRTGEVVIDTYQIVMPEGTETGEYLVEVGLYLAENGRRLQVTIPDLPDSDALNLTMKIEN